jgi:hypothetical protein
MRFQKLLPFVAVALQIFVGAVFADSVTLKNGEKLEGKITAETPAEITLDVKVSAGITEPRTIPRADVLKIEKESPDNIAWQSLKNLKPGNNSLPATAYDPIITALKNFTTQHATSPHAAEAQPLLNEFETEKKRVVGGEVKLNGKWLSKEEAQKERYQINAMLAYNHMRDQSTRGDLIGSLNTFDVIETQYPGGRAYADAVELARRVLAALKQDVDRRLPAAVQEMEQRRRAIDTAPDAQRRELIATLDREQAATDSALAAADRQRLKWPPLLRNERSLSAIQSRVAGEQQRLNEIDVAKLRRSIQLAEQARESFAKKELDAAEATARQATDLWYTNELATRLQTEISEARNQALTAAAAPPPEPEDPSAVTAARSKSAPGTDVPGVTGEGGDAQAEPERPFLLRPIGIITAIIALAFLYAAARAYKSIKGKASDVLE